MSKQAGRVMGVIDKRGRGHNEVARSALVPQKQVLLSICISERRSRASDLVSGHEA